MFQDPLNRAHERKSRLRFRTRRTRALIEQFRAETEEATKQFHHHHHHTLTGLDGRHNAVHATGDGYTR